MDLKNSLVSAQASSVSFYQSIRKYGRRHPFITGIIAICAIAALWYGYTSTTATSQETRYTLASAATSTIISTVSASGQVSSSDEVNIQAKVSGEVTWVGVKAGDTVYAGQALASIDNTDAKQSLLEAQQSLAADELQYQKDSAAAPIDYQKELDQLASDKEDLTTEYNDAFNSLSDTYLDLSSVISTANTTLYGYDLDTNRAQWNMDVLLNYFTSKDDSVTAQAKAFAQKSKDDYAKARAQYDASVMTYKQTSRSSDPAQIEGLLASSIDTTTDIAQALQSELNFLGAVTDLAQQYNMKLPTTVTTMQTNTRSALSTTNSDLSSLLAQKKAITSAKQAIVTDQQNITLLQVGNSSGDNPISLQISANSLASERQKIVDLKDALADYTVVAPFSGTISAINITRGDTVSGTVATIISKQQIAELSVNEVDAAKIKIGQKATLTFDAIDDLTMTGTVAEVDTVGTVSSGVVSYTVKIQFDTQNSSIKPGMTVNATIQTAAHQNVIVVPSSAVKTSNGSSYVLVFDPPLSDTGSSAVTSEVAPKQVEVTTGISDDTNVEILSGLTAGEQVVTKTTTGTAAKTTTSATKTSATSATRTTTSGNGGGPSGGAMLF